MSDDKCTHPSPFAPHLWLHAPGCCGSRAPPRPPSPPLAYSFTAPELDYYANPPSPILLSETSDEGEEDSEATQKYTPPEPSPSPEAPTHTFVEVPFWGNAPDFSYFKREPKSWRIPHKTDMEARIKNLVSCYSITYVRFSEMRNGTECWEFKGECPVCECEHEGYNFEYKRNKSKMYGGWKCFKTDMFKNEMYLA